MVTLFMKKWLILLSFGIALAARSAEPRPNIVFILADDLGAHDVGCFGSTYYETPNIDRLAKRGVRFTQAYAASPDLPDPMMDALRHLLDHLQQADARMDRMCEALGRMSPGFCDKKPEELKAEDIAALQGDDEQKPE